MSASDQLELRLLHETVRNPTFGQGLLSAERFSEEEDFVAVKNLLEPLLRIESASKSPLLFLAHYYLGQSIFRREMKRSRPKLKGIVKAMSHLKKSLVENPDFPDSHLLLTWTRMVHHRLDPENSELSKSAQHLHTVIANGSRIQTEEAQRLLTVLPLEDINPIANNDLP